MSLPNTTTIRFNALIHPPNPRTRPVPFRILVDSGASASSITRPIAREARLALRPPAFNIVCTLADGSRQSVDHVADVTFSIGSYTVHGMEVHIFGEAGSNTREMLLGMDWLMKANPVINWSPFRVSVLDEGNRRHDLTPLMIADSDDNDDDDGESGGSERIGYPSRHDRRRGPHRRIHDGYRDGHDDDDRPPPPPPQQRRIERSRFPWSGLFVPNARSGGGERSRSRHGRRRHHGHDRDHNHNRNQNHNHSHGHDHSGSISRGGGRRDGHSHDRTYSDESSSSDDGFFESSSDDDDDDGSHGSGFDGGFEHRYDVEWDMRGPPRLRSRHYRGHGPGLGSGCSCRRRATGGGGGGGCCG